MVAKHVGRRRLLVLADYLESHVAALPILGGEDFFDRSRFQMSVWFRKLDEHGRIAPFDRPRHKPRANECGTVGCALGWATTIPAFQRAGLALKCDKNFGEWVPALTGRRLESFRVAEEFFHLTEVEAGLLFSPRLGHRTIVQVANNIRQFVSTGALPGDA